MQIILARLKIIRIVLIATMIINSFIVNVIAASLKEANIYIFISFSMSEAALKDYFVEAESLGAKLIVRGLVNDSFQDTTAIANSLAIRFDIDPNLFEQYGVTIVPTIVIDDGIRRAKKLTGHLPLAKALEIMQEEKEQ